MSGFHVVVTDDRFDTSYEMEREMLHGMGANLELMSTPDPEEAIDILAGADGILLNHFSLNRAIIEHLSRTRIISRYGVGYDNVDVEAATEQGIWVSNVPDYGTEDVSDHTIALLLGCVRKLCYKDRRIREGAWNIMSAQKCFRVKDKVLGIIGYGRIGSAVHQKMGGFGLRRIQAYDPYVDPNLMRSRGCEPVGLEQLLKTSDYISLHAPLSTETRGMIGRPEIEMMKLGVIIINTARGPILDERAVIEGLESGRICYCGLDVFDHEPLEADSGFRDLDNIILSDHTAWYTEESQIELRTKAVRNVIEVLQGRRPMYPVNDLPAP